MRHWTLKERQKQSQLINRWQPWLQSTGAKTPQGKMISKMNAYKHGACCAEISNSARILAECKRAFNEIMKHI